MQDVKGGQGEKIIIREGTFCQSFELFVRKGIYAQGVMLMKRKK